MSFQGMTEYGLYGVGLAQPALKDDVDDEFLDRQDKVNQIRHFYVRKLRIPLCLDHCNAQHVGFVVPEHERIGYVLDMFIGRNDALMVKFKLNNNHPAYNQIHDGLTKRGEAWGLSVWVDRYRNSESGRVTKKLTHVALTLDPRFADYDTYMYRYSFSENLINNEILGRFYQLGGGGGCYATKELKRKLLDSARATGIRMSEQQQSAMQVDDQVAAVTTNTNDMVVENNSINAPIPGNNNNNDLADPSAAKKVRLEGDQTVGGDNNTTVVPLKEIDTTVDVSKLSGPELKRQMLQLYEHAKAKGCTPEQLPTKERTHFYRLNVTIADNAEKAKLFFQELKNNGDMNEEDAALWVNMLESNALDVLDKNNVATYAAATKSYAKKADDRRVAAEKRAHDLEEENTKLKASHQQQQSTATQGKSISTFQQQIQQESGHGQQQAQQQKTPNHPTDVQIKAVHAYYNKFGESERTPFGQGSAKCGVDQAGDFAAMFSQATMQFMAQPRAQVNHS